MDDAQSRRDRITNQLRQRAKEVFNKRNKDAKQSHIDEALTRYLRETLGDNNRQASFDRVLKEQKKRQQK